jgi:hypothetical protein
LANCIRVAWFVSLNGRMLRSVVCIVWLLRVFRDRGTELFSGSERHRASAPCRGEGPTTLTLRSAMSQHAEALQLQFPQDRVLQSSHCKGNLGAFLRVKRLRQFRGGSRANWNCYCGTSLRVSGPDCFLGMTLLTAMQKKIYPACHHLKSLRCAHRNRTTHSLMTRTWCSDRCLALSRSSNNSIRLGIDGASANMPSLVRG